MAFQFRPTNIDFMRGRKIAVMLSILLILASIGSLATRGLNFGIDFTGGTLVELLFEEAADLDAIRAALADSEFGDATVQTFGQPEDVMVRLAPSAELADAEVSNRVLELLPGAEMRRVEFVGPQVGDELTEDGGLAMLYALAGIFVYVMIRFQWKFAAGSIVALFHDVLIVVGFFSIVGIEFDLPVLAAILAVIGYSLNDTIVVFDRIRENFRRMRKADSVGIINASLNQTLARTLMTSLTTLIVLLALFFLGGEMIHAFATALIVGVLIGTYSSIYVAAPVTLALGVSKNDLMEVQKEGAELDARP
ncbi:MAG: protein translocase subunit SecF [Gammaproteobacteria bacterium]|nr:protein translocase subunit SecF [Gammaproteobacteria bacterium]